MPSGLQGWAAVPAVQHQRQSDRTTLLRTLVATTSLYSPPAAFVLSLLHGLRAGGSKPNPEAFMN